MNAILPRMLRRGNKDTRERTCPKCEKEVEGLTLRRSVRWRVPFFDVFLYFLLMSVSAVSIVKRGSRFPRVLGTTK